MTNKTAKAKVIHLVEDLRVGGLEKVLATIVLNLDKRKYDVEVWCLVRGGEIADELVRKGVQLKILELYGYYNPLNIIKLARLIKKSKIDILHTHAYFAGTFGRLASIITKTPVVIAHIHTTSFKFGKRSIFIDRFLAHYTHKIICISQAVKKSVVKIEKIDEKKICVIYNASNIDNKPCSLGEVESELIKWDISENDTVAITVASLVAHKGHTVLFKAVRSVLNEYADFKLLVMGTGPLRNKLENDVNELNISNKVVFTGLRGDVAVLLKASDIFILASTEREGLSVALIEAMATGLPVIASNLGGIPEVVKEEVNGILVPPKDVEKLACAIKRLVSDKRLRDEMGRQGQKVYKEKFTVRKMIQSLDGLYDELL